MKVTNGDIWVAVGMPGQDAKPLQEALAVSWPVKPSYWLGRLARKLGEHFAVIDQVRIGLIRQYGTTKENGDLTIQKGDEHWAEFEAGYNELMGQEVDIEGINKIVVPLGDDEGSGDRCPTCKRPKREIKPTTLMGLEPFVEVA